nr:odorant receptor 54 [Psyttalia incisi]
MSKYMRFEYYLGGDIFILKCLGLYSMDNIFENSEPNIQFWETVPFIVGVGGLCFGLVGDFRSLYIETLKRDLYAIEVLAAFLCSALGIYKGFRLWSYRYEYYHFIQAFYLRWNNELLRNTITETMVRNAKAMRSFRIWYATVVAAIFTSYVLRPCVAYLRFTGIGTNDTFDYSKTAYPAEYPFTVTTPKWFFICITFEAIGIYFLILYWISVDGLFAQLTTHLAIHFQILANRIRDTSVTGFMSPYHMEVVAQRLKKTVQDYLELFKYVNQLEKIYNPVLFGTVLVNGLNLCTCLYSLQYRVANNEWGLAGKNALLTTGITAQTMMFCICAQRLNDQILANRIRDTPTKEMIGPHHTGIVARRLKKTVQDYLELFRYINQLERIYNPILFGTVLINSLNLCTCLYSLHYRLANNEWGLAVKNALLTTGITAQTMMFCICAQRLHDQVGAVRQAAYDCPWTDFHPSLKTLILLIMIQTEPDYIYTAYGFVYLNMPQLTMVRRCRGCPSSLLLI